MADREEKSLSIPWLPLITLIGVGSGVLLFFPQLISSRPGGGDLQLARDTFDRQTIDARLWQDPLGVAVADRERYEKESAEEKSKYNQLHSTAQFQKLLIKRCFPVGANGPISRSAIYPLPEQWHLDQQVKQVQILAIMIPGGPYVEDVERRLRSRRAVIEGLGTAGYAPEKDDEIGYFYVPWQPLESNVSAGVRMLEENRSKDQSLAFEENYSGIQPFRNSSKAQNANGLLVPYEWCEPATFGSQKNSFAHVLVLWLIDDAFRDVPLARLADLISWFRLKRLGISPNSGFSPAPAFNVLGPDNSGTLRAMVMEANDNRWNDETRQCLVTTHIFSSQAAAAEAQLLSGIPAQAGTRLPLVQTCKDLIERNVKQQSPENGFSFERFLLPDNLIVKTMWKELQCRGLRRDDHVAIISEEDTYYARSLCSAFRESRPKAVPDTNLHSYIYLRGIDGKLPTDGKDEPEKRPGASGDKNPQSFARPPEQTEGLNQADDIRRLAGQLQQLDKRLKSSGSRSLKAVGLLGSDVYDKLELLKALRPLLPEALFFTNNLDARFAHPDEWNETHNLVVVSAFGLSLEDFEGLPPFRDSGQTALFAATLKAMDGSPSLRSPLIFEIGRNGPKELGTPREDSPALPEVSARLARLAQSYMLQIAGCACFAAIGILLLLWTRFFTRVAPPSGGTKTNAEKIRNQELVGNESADHNYKHLQAT